VAINRALKALGPGILFAAAAIGASHIVQSTRAGADYGFGLLVFVLLSNFLKYPFFEFGHRYTAATGESIIEGYRKLGKWAVVTFLALNLVTSVVSTAGVTIVSSALTALVFSMFFDIQLDTTLISIAILIIVSLVLYIGKYNALDKIVKFLIAILAISTTFAFALAASKGMNINPEFQATELWNTAGIGFLLALMGWMPAPIEASSWSSLWAIERGKMLGKMPTLSDALIDFKVGYIGTAILACFFLGLGAFTMYGTGETFSNSAVVFVSQVVELFTKQLGSWSTPLIAAIAWITMASTTMTVVDAYPRAIEASLKSLFDRFGGESKKLYWIIFAVMCFVASVIIAFFGSSIKLLLDFATVISFLAAPIFAYLNYKTVTSVGFPKEARPGKILTSLSYIGLLFLIGFSLLYIFS